MPDDFRDRSAKYKHSSAPLDRKYTEQITMEINFSCLQQLFYCKVAYLRFDPF
jgi:hypothetical protein